MRHPRAVAVLAALGFMLAACGAEPRYPSLRQTTEEEVPGSWGLILRPAPDDLDPAISPKRAIDIALRADPPEEGVFQTLALVDGGSLGYGDEELPAWVVFARNLCFAESKGDLVSSSRRDPEDVERCSERNLWVEVIDPMSGESLASLGAYDETGTWLPARGA
jgi:hypothetical protein